MRRGPLARWQQRGGRTVRLLLTFEDIMEFALALLSVSPAELRDLGWTFADRKRLLDHFLASGKEAQLAAPEQLRAMPIELVVPQRDVDRLLRFARKELPKAASNAAMLDRVLKSLEAGSHRPEVRAEPNPLRVQESRLR
ncbi:hypothetical protein FPZ24_04670 [Sphingomonas panacisoli]|uniref:Uncharacterized protein n=2 Tax=Sphingomonas panacisoli TaxID=1813879 RepID=A0A5B8LMW8_9SPHN|nr:hypothetical protein FPZ24_04670 [Sphingomonas panacisoli]